MSAEKIDPALLFGDPDHGSCCSCCEGFCPLWEGLHSDGFDGPLASVTSGGVEYLGLHTCLIRRDMLADLPEKVEETVIPAGIVNPPWAVVPVSRPTVDARPQSAQLLDRLDRAGITRHEGDDVVHLYVGDAHVGWCKWNSGKAGTLAADLSLIRTIAFECGITVNAASVALHFARGGEVA